MSSFDERDTNYWSNQLIFPYMFIYVCACGMWHFSKHGQYDVKWAELSVGHF